MNAIDEWVNDHPQNVEYPIVPGDVWLYRDTNREKRIVKWGIQSAPEDGKVRIRKLDGANPGFERMYDAAQMQDEDWRPFTTQTEPIILWPCPCCGEDEPVPVGDYVCVVCRNGLDTEE